MDTIRFVTDNMLCSACGTCAAVCPRKAIDIKLLPSGFFAAEVQEADCTQCGLCVSCCPSVALKEPVFTTDVKLSVIGYAKDEQIRSDSQSGGMVTALLIDLLQKGKIDGVVVTTLNADGLPEAIWADTKEKIQTASGSVYAQSSVIKVLYEHRHQKCAVVTLGCQTEAILRTCQRFQTLSRPDYVIGLICGGTMSLWMKEELLHRMHLRADKAVDSFHYRDKHDGGWPGNITAYSGEKCYHLDKNVRMMLKPAFECYRCTLCAEKMNIHADIVVGDPWSVDEDHSKGRSVALAYTDKGRELLENSDQCLIWETISVEQIYKGQSIGERYRQKVLSHNKAAQDMGHLIPYILPSVPGIDMQDAKTHLLHAQAFYGASSKRNAMHLAHHTIRKVEQPIKNRLYQIKTKFLGK